MQPPKVNYPVHLLHIGKTGGSAIKHALAEHPLVHQERLVLHRHKTTIYDVPEGEGICFFLRDPVTRFASAFYSRQRKGQPRYNSEWNAVEKEVFDAFHSPNELARALGDDASPQHALALKAMDGIRHFRLYSDWYGTIEAFRRRQDDVVFVGFQEDLDADFSRFLKEVGISDDIRLPKDDVAAHRNPTHADYSLSPRARSVLQNWYAEDYDFAARCRALMADRRS